LDGIGIQRGPLPNMIGQIDEMDQNLEESNKMQISRTKKFGKKKGTPKV
jgi:hypothetical protein